jgi:predicted  nucleic acid-binding Zn-ribbon protein
MRNYRLVPGILIALLVSGCATMDKSECRQADWQMVGIEDGAKGHPVSYIGNHRKACAEYGVQPDLAQYQLGHQAGLVQFCTASNGFNQGRAGRKYNEVCPAGLREQFVRGYNTGRELNLLNSEIDHMRRDAELKKDEMAELEERINNIETVLVSGAISVKDRETLLEQFKKLQSRLTTLENDIRGLNLAVARRQHEYEILDSSHGFY